MAGSYGHVVDDEGRLLDGEGINSMLECRSGDVVECVEEMYGMIWHLSGRLLAWQTQGSEPLTEEQQRAILRGNVEQARQHYREGLAISPGTDARLPDDEED